MCDVVDVSWLTAGPAEVEFTWGTVKGTLRRDPRSWDSVPSDQSLVFASSKSDSEWLTVRYADGRGHPSIVRVVSPAPPVTPAAEEWADRTEVLRQWKEAAWDEGWEAAKRGEQRRNPHRLSAPDLVADLNAAQSQTPCPPGLTPVDLDRVADDFVSFYHAKQLPTVRECADWLRSYRRSGSAER